MLPFQQGKLFVCTAGKENFSIQANVPTSSSRKTCPGLHTSKQNLSRRINLWGKTCSLYTRASEANKELVKENLFVCAGFFCEHLNWSTILKSLGLTLYLASFQKRFSDLASFCDRFGFLRICRRILVILHFVYLC